jgi:hypothetical protein
MHRGPGGASSRQCQHQIQFQIIAARRERIRFATSREKPCKAAAYSFWVCHCIALIRLISGFTPESTRSVAH